jgi:hypothetical protein
MGRLIQWEIVRLKLSIVRMFALEQVVAFSSYACVLIIASSMRQESSITKSACLISLSGKSSVKKINR